MGLAAGIRLGPYEIVAPLGAGGMGEVYRARDTRLDRTVAIKVLSSALTASPELKARFDREARAISVLQHPNICVLHDVGNDNGIDYLVMEYLEGESLADRLRRGPVPLEQVLKIGIEVADALDRAHRAGIIHRDLKPANVMLTKSGAKLLDFGLAKPIALTKSASSDQTAASVLANALTLSNPLPVSSAGAVVGTVQYMAPEQLSGREADARSDVFAFAVLLYEMTTGKRAFDGKTQSSIVGQILAVDPPGMESLQPMTPPGLARLVRSCLAKDPEERYQTVHDVKLRLLELRDSAPFAAIAHDQTFSQRRRAFRYAMLGLLIAAIAVAIGAWVGSAYAPAPLLQSSIVPPAGATFNFVGPNSPPVLSPDGTQVAFAATQNGVRRIWVRPLNSAQARPLAGTEEGVWPFWSPDSKNLGFLAGGKLKRIDISGGPPMALCDVEQMRGAAWNANGTIIFARYPGVIYKVTAQGGTPEPITKLDSKRGDTTHRWPVFLPDGDHFLYMASSFGSANDVNAIFGGSLKTGEAKLIFSASSNTAYVDGYLVYARGNTLIAQPFDPRRLEFTGEPQAIVEKVDYDAIFSKAIFSVSNTGRLVYRSGTDESDAQVLLLGSDGKIVRPINPTGLVLTPRISPDGKSVAASEVDTSTGNSTVWIYDLERGTRTRFTFDKSRNTNPIWSRDGKQIAFASSRLQIPPAPYIRDTNGMTAERKVTVRDDFAAKQYLIPTCFTRDDKTLVVSYRPVNTGRIEIQLLNIAEGTLRPLLRNDSGNVSAGELSPDNRWIAYMMNDGTAPTNVYVSPFPNTSAKFQVSTLGGVNPRWSGDGKHLYFLSGDSHIMVADVDGSGTNFRLGPVREFFTGPSQLQWTPAYDIAPDSKRFVVTAEQGEGASEPLTLVTNWKALLKR